jgi:hypothetical protein
MQIKRSSIPQCNHFSLLLVFSLISTLSAQAGSFSPGWKAGDSFHFSVKVYPRSPASGKASSDAKPADKEPAPIASYRMAVALNRLLPFEECGCWKLQFLTFSKLPAYKDVYFLWIDWESGKTRKASRFHAPKTTELAAATMVPMLLDAPEGYPLEFYPAVNATGLATERPDTTLDLSVKMHENFVERTAIVRVGGKPEIEVRQHWAPGAKWWSEYNRFYRGQLDLSARIVPTTPPPPAQPPKPAEPPPFGGILRQDSRLQIPINSEIHHRPVQELLDLLSGKTGVVLTMGEPLAAVAPEVAGNTTLNVPAWKVLEDIAHNFVVDGRWDKTDVGYQLSASAAMLPRNPTPAPIESKALRAWLSGLTAALLTGVSAWLLMRRRRNAHSPSAPVMAKGDTA